MEDGISEIQKKKQLFKEREKQLNHEFREGKISQLDAMRALEVYGEKLTGKQALWEARAYLDQKADEIPAGQQEKQKRQDTLSDDGLDAGSRIPRTEHELDSKHLSEVYKWSLKLATEQETEKDYLWTDEGRRLLMRLETGGGGLLLGVVGLQGSGKTALKEALVGALYEKNRKNDRFKVLSFKWGPEVQVESQLEDRLQLDLDYDDKYVEELWYSILERCVEPDDERSVFSSSHSEIFRFLKVETIEDERLVDKVIKKEGSVSQLKSLIPLFEKRLGRQKVIEIKKEFQQGFLQNTSTILIDLPDYGKGAQSTQDADMRRLQFWRENMLSDSTDGYSQRPNLVIFIQKELYNARKNFFQGKLNVIVLKPLQADELVRYYTEKFGSKAPFSKESLKMIADLSRGVFRRFKNYICTCIEKMRLVENKNEVSLTDVTAWITEGQLVQDMELADLFPNEKILRLKTVKLLHLLKKNGPILQTQITGELFDGHKMQASRFLDRLEAYDYITRERCGTKGRKMVKLSEGGGQ